MASDGSDDDDDDSGVSADLSPVSGRNQNAPSESHEAAIEREIRRTAEMERGMRRFKGTPPSSHDNNRDVMEMAFKTPVTLLPWPQPPSKPGPGRDGGDWKFSEQKMRTEIDQDVQRELALVRLGKFPGVYSKGTVRQLRERMRLFEAFQRGVAGGLGRHRRPGSSTSRPGVPRHVHPSVLERTRSLENVLSCPKDHPGPETRRGGEGGKRKELEKDVTYLSQEGYLRLCKSMDSLNLESTAPIEKAIREEVRRGEKAGEAVDKGSAVVRENPFFKLRASRTLENYIREAREREEELRRQRCSLYGDAGRRQPSTEDHTFLSPASLATEDARRPSRGKLDLTWPPPPLTDGQTQETKVSKPGALKPRLRQRWEEGRGTVKHPRDKD